MYLATWLIFVQLFAVIIAGVATCEKVRTDADGKATCYPTNIYLWYGVRVVRCFAVLALWGGAITVIVSVVCGYHRPEDRAKSIARASELGRRKR